VVGHTVGLALFKEILNGGRFTMTQDQKNLIIEAAEEAREKGWYIRPGNYVYPEMQRCCPLGAVSIKYSGADDRYEVWTVQDVLKLPANERGAFACGFDSVRRGFYLDEIEAYNFGEEMRKRYAEA
jgi:hypothetical protein